MKSIFKTIVNSQTFYQLSVMVITWYVVGFFSEAFALWCIVGSLLCWLCLMITPYITVLVKHQSHPDHINAILIEGFNKPHNEEKLLADGYDARYLGQLGQDNISFTTVVLDTPFEKMLRRVHDVDTLGEIWVRVTPNRALISQAVSFGWLNINHGWGIEVVADRQQVNTLIRQREYTTTKPHVTFTDYLNIGIVLLGGMCSPLGLIDIIDSFKAKKLNAIKL